MEKFFIFTLILCLLVCGCLSLQGEKSFYTLTPDEEFSDGIDGGGNLDYGFSIKNESEKTICKFSISFSIFDEEGEPAFYSDYVNVDFEKEIEAGEDAHFSMDLSEFFESDPSKIYIVDFIYANRIEYTDGSIWEDFFGVYAAK